jgi:hypothetical protein
MARMAKYEVRLTGKQARLGNVAAVDVARLIFDVQTTIARAAGVAIGRRPKATGRWEGTLEEATKLRLVKIKRGSVLIELQPPDASTDEGALDLDVDSLADLGWATATRAMEDPSRDDSDPDVLYRLLGMADHLAIGTRFESVEFRTDGQVVGILNAEKRETLRTVVANRREATTAPPSIAGILFEADFERHTAKVRTQDDTVVEVIFEESQADTIKDALRERSEFQGEATIDPITNSIKSVRLRRITRFEQLLLGDGSQAYWHPLAFDELAAEQGTGAVSSFENLRDTTLTDDEFEQFLQSLS